jgi:DNA-binding CsgD family transcriptional regulator
MPLDDGYAARQLRWSKADENMLRKQYGKIESEELAERLGRTVKALHAHARNLGLSLRAANPALPQLWTAKEDAILRRMFPTRTNPEIAERLGRPLKSVIARARKLGLLKERPGFKEWTAREDRQLRQLYPKHTPTEIAERLGRTLSSVRGRMYKIGILVRRTPKPPTWTAKEDRLLKQLYGRRTLEEIAERLGRSVNAVKLRASRTGVRATANRGGQVN